MYDALKYFMTNVVPKYVKKFELKYVGLYDGFLCEMTISIHLGNFQYYVVNEYLGKENTTVQNIFLYMCMNKFFSGLF